jgi:hypothetical protein
MITQLIENGTIAVKSVYQADAKLIAPLFRYFHYFLLDQAIKSVIDSYCLSKDKKRAD